MPARLMQEKVVVTINSTGRQAASFIRVASAIGWHVRAQMKDKIGLVADEICNLPNVTPVVGSLEDPKLIAGLFRGADIAFINTTHWGDEIAIGRALADAAKKAGIQHYIYSSMPDHSIYEKGWKPLPLWAHKFAVENYIRSLGMPATFVYAGIYHNNFTSLDYPLFRMELQHDGSFVWRAPFNPDVRLPWLDVEHDVGPALLQIFKEGPRKWSGHRIPLAFSMMSPREVCEAFSRGLDRPVYYVRDGIHINVPVPSGYREHLKTLEETLGKREAPYFGPKMHSLTQEALDLWEGFRDMEEYAREVFPIEEAENGLTWMDEVDTPSKEIELDFQGSC